MSEFLEIYSISKNSSQHIIGLTSENYLNCVVYCAIKVYGIPEGIDQTRSDEILEDESKAVYLGKITGFLVLAEDMVGQGLDVYTVCDDMDGDLEFVVSALAENCGPLSSETGGIAMNHFYIHEITLEDAGQNLFTYIIRYLPDMLFTHYHIRPKIFSYYPKPLPHEESRMDKMKKDLAMMAHYEMMNRFVNGIEDVDEPQLVMSKEQSDIVMGRRTKGTSYPYAYKNMKLWNLYEDAGFQEWENTRVLYLYTDDLEMEESYEA